MYEKSVIHRWQVVLGRIEPATIGPMAALLAMLSAFSVLSPYFLTSSNLTNVLVQSAPLLVLAAGQTFALLMGGLDLSQGSIVSLVSVVTAGVTMHHSLVPGAAAGIRRRFGHQPHQWAVDRTCGDSALHRHAWDALYRGRACNGLLGRLIHLRPPETGR